MLPNAQRERENIKILDSPQCPERERHREREKCKCRRRKFRDGRMRVWECKPRARRIW
jgi:hypothetical protein